MKVFKSTKPVQDERFQRGCEKLREYKEGKGRSKMCRAFAMGLPIESVEQLVSLSIERLNTISQEIHSTQ